MTVFFALTGDKAEIKSTFCIMMCQDPYLLMQSRSKLVEGCLHNIGVFEQLGTNIVAVVVASSATDMQQVTL